MAGSEMEVAKMAVSTRAKKLVAELDGGNTKMSDIKRRAKEIKTDHALAEELWASGQYVPRLLSVLVLDKKQLTQSAIDELASDMLGHAEEERNQLADWFLANQLTKDRKLISLIEAWEQNASPLLRRLFWYFQARLRWTGQAPPGNTGDLLVSLEKNMPTAEPVVQWAMNFCAGQIGVHEPKFRSRCIKLGKRVGLYKDEDTPRNCTPSYLPEFIRIEAAKREEA